MRQAVALFESAQKREMSKLKMYAGFVGVEFKESEEQRLSDVDENKLLNARMKALERIRKEKENGKNSL